MQVDPAIEGVLHVRLKIRIPRAEIAAHCGM
jgi:hypothetical protein